MAASASQQLTAGKYLSLESFRKNGAGVRTPVWFAVADDGKLYAYTRDDSWKVKRIRNNPHVRVAACDARGNVKGDWLDANARVFGPGEPETVKAHRLLDRKYLLKRLADWLMPRFQKRQVGIVIELLQDGAPHPAPRAT